MIDDACNDRDILEPQPITVPIDPTIDQSTEPDKEIPSRRSQRIKTPALSNDYIYLNESDINFGQANDPNNFNEALPCSERNNGQQQFKEN